MISTGLVIDSLMAMTKFSGLGVLLPGILGSTGGVSQGVTRKAVVERYPSLAQGLGRGFPLLGHGMC